jgi:aminoglycoside/choline kinase family phosphotransferase
MKDAGTPLRNSSKVKFNPELLIKAINLYANIQIASIDYTHHLISLGVNDWRLKNIPLLYDIFIQNEGLLLEDGLQPAEIKKLRELMSKLIILCEELSKYTIPETIEHGDFHDNNILIEDTQITINDWGDASISHPFFSCVSVLDSAKRNHGLQETDSRYKACQQVYLDKWRQYGENSQLREAFHLAKKIKHFTFALSFSRVKICPGIEMFPEYNGYIAASMRKFIKEFL